MAGKKGYKAANGMRGRDPDKRGGNKSGDFPQGERGSLAAEALRYLRSLAVKNYSEGTIEARKDSLKTFILWAHERDLHQPDEITKPILESFQRHLWRYRKINGKPLGISTQRARLGTLRDLFKYLSKQNLILANPASELELPRPEKRLPEQALSLNQVRQIFNIPDLLDPLGVRDRTILELFYSSGIRRSELARLELTDLNQERQVLQVRKGKGNKDRVAPVGNRALHWLQKYLEEVRPKLALDQDEKALFLTAYGEGFNPDVLSRMVSKFIKQADLGRAGSCHLLRHAHARRRGRYPLHPATPWPRKARNDQHLHASEHRAAESSSRQNSPGGGSRKRPKTRLEK